MLLTDLDEDHFQTCFEQYVEAVPSKEKNLVLIRFVLYMMIHKKMKEAFQVNEFFKNIQGYAASNESQMLGYLFRAAKVNNLEIYQAIIEKYDGVIGRDPSVKKMVDKVGEDYCGAESNGGFNMFSMIQNLLK